LSNTGKKSPHHFAWAQRQTSSRLPLAGVAAAVSSCALAPRTARYRAGFQRPLLLTPYLQVYACVLRAGSQHFLSGLHTSIPKHAVAVFLFTATEKAAQSGARTQLHIAAQRVVAHPASFQFPFICGAVVGLGHVRPAGKHLPQHGRVVVIFSFLDRPSVLVPFPRSTYI